MTDEKLKELDAKMAEIDRMLTNIDKVQKQSEHEIAESRKPKRKVFDLEGFRDAISELETTADRFREVDFRLGKSTDYWQGELAILSTVEMLLAQCWKEEKAK